MVLKLRIFMTESIWPQVESPCLYTSIYEHKHTANPFTRKCWIFYKHVRAQFWRVLPVCAREIRSSRSTAHRSTVRQWMGGWDVVAAVAAVAAVVAIPGLVTIRSWQLSASWCLSTIHTHKPNDEHLGHLLIFYQRRRFVKLCACIVWIVCDHGSVIGLSRGGLRAHPSAILPAEIINKYRTSMHI